MEHGRFKMLIVDKEKLYKLGILYDEAYGYRPIADKVGISKSTVYRWGQMWEEHKKILRARNESLDLSLLKKVKEELKLDLNTEIYEK